MMKSWIPTLVWVAAAVAAALLAWASPDESSILRQSASSFQGQR